MEAKSHHFKWIYLLISLILCTTGILVMLYPTESLVTISYIVAICAILAGILFFCKIIVKKHSSAMTALYIILSLSTLACGIVALILPEDTMNIYPMFIGLFIIVDSSFKLHSTLTSDSPKDTYWWFMFWTACLTIVSGFVVARIRTTDVDFGLYAFFLGFAILMGGITNFLAPFLTVGIKKKTEDAKSESTDTEAEPEHKETRKERKRRLKEEEERAKKLAKSNSEKEEDSEPEDDYIYEDDENADTRYVRICDIDDYED